MGEKQLQPPQSQVVSRRNFFQIMLGLGGGVVLRRYLGGESGGKQSIAKDRTFEDGGIDIVNHPEYFVGPQSAERKEHLVRFLEKECHAIHRMLLSKKEGETDGWRSKDVTDALTTFLDALTQRARAIFLAEKYRLNVRQIVIDRYYEVASYVQMILDLIQYRNTIGVDQFYKEILTVPTQITLDVTQNSPLESAIHRKEISAVWNYDWKSFFESKFKFWPTYIFFLSSDLIADSIEFTFKPLKYEADNQCEPNIIHPPIPHGDEKFLGRPNKVEFVQWDPNVAWDPDVANEIQKQLESVGMERTMYTLSLVSGEFLWGLTSIGEDTSSCAVGYQNPETLDMQQYKDHEREILKVVLHEAYHSLGARRWYLSDTDLLILRHLEYQLLALGDPLADLHTLFDPDGDYHGYIEDNLYSLTRYYIENVMNVYGNMESSASVFWNECCTFISTMIGDKTLSAAWSFTQGESLEEISRKVLKEFPTYSVTTRYIVQLFLENIVDISKRKCPAIGGGDVEYVNQMVLPLLFSHIILYKFDDFENIVLSSLSEHQDKTLVRNYLITLKKRFRSFVYGSPGEEYIAELFSEALLTKKFGKHRVPFVQKALPICQRILSLMRKNKLAVGERPDAM